MSLEYNRDQSMQPNTSTQPNTTAQPDPAKAVQVDQMKLQAYLQEIRDNQNLGIGIVAGTIAALIGAILWGIITAVTMYQIGFMAIGVGFLVGWSVRQFGKGIGQPFAVAGAVLSLFGCLLGNLISACIFVAKAMEISISEVFSQLDFQVATQLLKETFRLMDLLFYGLALYFGYKYSLFRIPEGKVKELTR